MLLSKSLYKIEDKEKRKKMLLDNRQPFMNRMGNRSSLVPLLRGGLGRAFCAVFTYADENQQNRSDMDIFVADTGFCSGSFHCLLPIC
jgi:hypothetical protein